MNHRKRLPILLIPSICGFFVVFAHAEPGVPTETNSTAAPTKPAVTHPATTPAPAPVTAATDTSATSGSTYTVVAGDSVWLIAHKNHCTVKQLEKLNNLKPKPLLHPGQVLKLPPATTTPAPTPTNAPAAAPATKPDAAIPQARPPKRTKLYAKAQPVQDFDIPASTFASCPVPLPSETDDAPPAPVAQLVSPQELTSDSVSPTTTVATTDTETATTSEPITPAPLKVKVKTTPAPAPVPTYTAKLDADTSSRLAQSTPAPAPTIAPSTKQSNRGFFGLFSSPNPLFTTPSSDWSNRFTQEARELGDKGIEYDEDWRPPGESHSWTMDCSNTTRYLYKVTTGIQLPRTASDQYYYLHLQNKAWDVPQAANGFADVGYLRENLKPGDLLFWENTYRPERQPPITHVMVFLGTNDKGQWIMAGSQTSRGGEHNRRNGGPDIYVFDPTQSTGGYTTWLGFVHHKGRFCAYGRPLEADKTKLAVAAND